MHEESWYVSYSIPKFHNLMSIVIVKFSSTVRFWKYFNKASSINSLFIINAQLTHQIQICRHGLILVFAFDDWYRLWAMLHHRNPEMHLWQHQQLVIWWDETDLDREKSKAGNQKWCSFLGTITWSNICWAFLKNKCMTLRPSTDWRREMSTTKLVRIARIKNSAFLAISSLNLKIVSLSC